MDQVQREEPTLNVDIPPMPDRIGVEGVEFVEFAADQQGAAELASLLRMLGFAEVARHRSKEVVLFRQGEINVVINTDRQGFAHSSFVVHGMSAYALGLRVEDAAATVTRARALGAEVFQQPVGPGELSIPAIHGVGGGLIYFLDEKTSLSKLWDIDFTPVAAADKAGDAGLLRIDHVGQTMSQEEMPSWLLFYVSIFLTRKTPLVDVVDPAGLIRSQVVEGLDNRFRLTLNGAESHRTLAGHFIAEAFGSGVQHLALSTGNIFATAEKLRAHGFKALEISANYYDDVEARFGLEPEVADRLRAANILYDRDEKGEFFQLYAPTFAEGFILEIVERRGGYGGYGAPNAPFRIAAQKRPMRPKGMPRLAQKAL